MCIKMKVKIKCKMKMKWMTEPVDQAEAKQVYSLRNSVIQASVKPACLTA